MSELGNLLKEAGTLYDAANKARQRNSDVTGQARKMFLAEKENVRAALFAELEKSFPFLSRKHIYNSSVNVSESGLIWIWCIFRAGTLGPETKAVWENGKKIFEEGFRECVRKLIGLDQSEEDIIRINIQFDSGDDLW